MRPPLFMVITLSIPLLLRYLKQVRKRFQRDCIEIPNFGMIIYFLYFRENIADQIWIHDAVSWWCLWCFLFVCSFFVCLFVYLFLFSRLIIPLPTMRLIQISLRLILCASVVTKCVRTLRLDQSYQKLETVPRNLTADVTELDLTGNGLKTLNGSSFEMYRMLTTITLDWCKTEIIEDGTFENQDRLVTLNLAYCNIIRLPQKFGPSIQTLVSWNMFSGYSSGGIFVYPYFTAFQSLRSLKLGGTDMSSFNASLLPTSLTSFKSAGSALQLFPNFSNARHLRAIILFYNEIPSIPQDNIATLSSLTSISLSSNRITAIPNFSHLKTLRVISLSNNDITIIPTESIKGLQMLRTFGFGENKINKMPNVSYLSQLSKIMLHKNLIQYVPASCLYGLSSKLQIDLSENRIAAIEDITVHIRGTVLLHDNLLVIPPDLYEMDLETLSLQGNPLFCNQSLCWLRMWSWNKTPLNMAAVPMCSNPTDLNGTFVTQAHPTQLKCYNGRLE